MEKKKKKKKKGWFEKLLFLFRGGEEREAEKEEQPMMLISMKPPPAHPVNPELPWSPPVTIAIVNQTTVLKDEQVRFVMAAIQKQITRDLALAWGVDARLKYFRRGSLTLDQLNSPAANKKNIWPVFLLDTPESKVSLNNAYHVVEITDTLNVPFGKVFAKSDMELGMAWSVSLSHQILELLVDPFADSCVIHQTKTGSTTVVYPIEICDPTEADNHGYVIDNVLVSNFIHPSWFGSSNHSINSRFDQMNHMKDPFQILPGGSILTLTVSPDPTGWKNEEHHKSHSQKLLRSGSRRDRRRQRLARLD